MDTSESDPFPIGIGRLRPTPFAIDSLERQTTFDNKQFSKRLERNT